MKLTLAKIKTLPIGKKISDGQGLCLTKTAPNKGRWEHRYMINKRARVMALGTYPEIPLIKARQIHFAILSYSNFSMRIKKKDLMSL